jgi:hypothetical protein
MSLFNQDLIKNKEKTGVEGMLLLLCVGLTVLSPLYNLLLTLAFTQMVFDAKNQVNDRLPQFLSIAINLASIIFSVVSGILLWHKKRLGVFLARILFIAVIALAAGDLLLLAATGNPVNVWLQKLALGIVLPALWLIYLFRSERVKNTYRVMNK